MKNLFTAAIAVMALAIVTTSAYAQAPGPKGQPGQKGAGRQGQGQGQMGRMMRANQEILKELNLTDKQKAEFKKFGEARREKMMKLREQGKQDPQAMRANMQEMRTEYEAFLKKTLTKEQLEKHEKLTKEYREKMMKERGGQAGAGRPGKKKGDGGF